MRIALIADVHGNVLALEAVLRDFQRRGVDAVWNLGDHLSGPLWAAATADRLMSERMLHVRGNHDRQLLDRSDAAAFGELTDEHKAWLAALPAAVRAQGVLLCHGTPVSDAEYLLERPDGSGLAASADIVRRLEGTAERVVVCGHTHIPRVVTLPGGRVVVNPGSVGLPAYHADDHDMECGSPHARYAIVEKHGDAIMVEQLALEYDWESAARKADAGGRPDWAHALRTGYALPAS